MAAAAPAAAALAAGTPGEMEGSSTYRALAWSDADDVPEVAPTDPYDYPDGQAYAGGVTGARPQLQFGEPEPAAAADLPWYRRPAVALAAGVLVILAALAVAVFVLRDDDTPAPSSTTTPVTTTTEAPATTTVAPPPAQAPPPQTEAPPPQTEAPETRTVTQPAPPPVTADAGPAATAAGDRREPPPPPATTEPPPTTAAPPPTTRAPWSPTAPYPTIPGLPWVPAPQPTGQPRSPRLAGMTQTDGLLFDPNTYDPQQFDAETRRLLRATIDWFEGQGKKRILDDDLAAQWPADFVEFVKREKLFATFLTPSEFADGNPDKRWDAARNAALAEILGFYGLTYWYTEQVTILGLGPIWQSENKDAKLKAADDLEAGAGDGVRAVRARARRRRLQHRHGAHARQAKRTAPTASCTGRRGRSTTSATATSRAWCRCSDGAATSTGSDAYVFFAADSRHENYHLIDNVVHMQIYVSTFRLENYPVRAEDILHTGVEAFAAALNTVNVGKFNLCSCVDRHDRARLLRGDHPRAEPHPLRQPGHRLRARAGELRRLRTRGWSR